MENQDNSIGINSEMFKKDLASEIGIVEIEALPLEMSLYVPQLEIIEIPNDRNKKEPVI